MSEDELTGTGGYSSTGRPRGIGFPVETESTESDGYVIRGVEVEVHQKKDNPFEHGHYDVLVRLTSDLLPSVDPRTVIGDLLDLAQEQVQAEIGQWLDTIQEAHRGEIVNKPYPAPKILTPGLTTAPGPSGAGEGPPPRPSIPPLRDNFPCMPVMSNEEVEETIAEKMARVDTRIANEVNRRYYSDIRHSRMVPDR